MTVNRTTLLDLPLPVTGTESGTWGDTTNNGLTQYVDIAIAGMSNLTSANFTAGALTIETTEGDSSATNISATSAQYAGFRVTSLAANSTITVGNTGTSPARSYRLINADATYSLTFKATGQTGVTLLPGQSALVAFNGTDYVIVGTVGAGSTTDNTVPRFDGTTGKILQSSGITIDDSNNVSGVAQLNITTLDATNIEVTNIKAKDGTAAASIADSTGVISVTANPVLSGGTANGVLYLNGSKVATSGSALTFDGSAFAVTGASTVPLKIQDISSAPSSQLACFVGPSTSAFTSVNGDLILAPRTSTGASLRVYTGNGTSAERYSIDSVGVAVWSVSGSEQMRLTSTGLGIGTSSPSRKLTVSGSGVFTDGTNDITIWNDGSIGTNGSVNLKFNTNGSLRATLDTSGNLGLGVTPSAWGGGYKAMTINQGRSIAGTNSGAGDFSLVFNAFYDATDNRWEYEYTGDPATRYSTNSGVHAWYTAPSGTAGNAITFTQAMTLDASGNLKIGTTGGSAKLVVYQTTDDTTGGVQIYATNGAGAIISRLTDGGLTFRNGGAERARITSGGDLQVSSGGSFQVGGTAARATTAGTNRIDIFNGTAPVGALTNGISLYSSSGEAYVMDAAGNATLFSPHDAETNEWVFKSKHTPTGKVLKIDVEKLLRFVNDHFGLDAVHEFVER